MFVDPAAFALVGHLVMTAADAPPALNLEPSCRGAAQMAVPKADGQLPTAAEMRDVCLGKERAARDDLSRQWQDFDRDHRASCVRSTTAGGIPSYVELLTCLEIAKEARRLPDPPLRGTTGMSGGSARR